MRLRRVVPLVTCALVVAGSPASTASAHESPLRTAPSARAAQAFTAPPATPRAACGPGSQPETGIQGRVPPGAPADGFRCNTMQVSREGTAGGYKVERYVDRTGRECAYYDTTLLFPTNAGPATLSLQQTGTAVLDMSDPARPIRTATLATPAMQSPHESLLLNQRRGLLAAVFGNPTFGPGQIDLYDISSDCRNPVLQSTTPTGVLGHESGFTDDGRTFYATTLGRGTVTAVDVSDPKLPRTLWVGNHPSHGLTLNDAGTRAYLAASDGLTILDVSDIQERRPNPQPRVVSTLTWPEVTIPQAALPVTIGGKPMLVEIDEFSATADGDTTSHGIRVGAGRIIDISDEKAPKVISNIRLAVHQPEHRVAIADDPGASSPVQGYAGHYCSVPRQVEPGIVACSMIASGLRVFDIRDPYAPREIAYFVAPPAPLGANPAGIEKSNYAMSKPSFAPGRNEIWYSDGNSGFYAVRVTNGAWASARADGGSTLGLPRARRCLSRRDFTIRLRPKGRLRSARVWVDGKRVRVVRSRGRLRARVDVRGARKGRVAVRIVARTEAGSTIRAERRYRTCTSKRRGGRRPAFTAASR